ncbi:MAG: polyprenyl synthetase family protein [Candidatus Eisenbacteria bacterium]|nr:polyprenyl synthetase family protein [Candidatus Eisenbacteria bacterium]
MTDPRLRDLMSERRDEVEAALDRYLPPSETPPERLHEAMRYSVFSGGKRLRPILVLLACEVAGGESGPAASPACATELIHTYSLIHDDLPAMDDDDVRRGRPTWHRAFDEATAILAGDALLTLAFELAASDASLPPESRSRIVTVLAKANGGGGMVGGQAADMDFEGGTPTEESVTFIHRRKTAMPIEAAVRIGGIVAGASENVMAALSSYGRAVGLAFQIADDLLDLTGEAEEMGKAVGKDAAAGKLTYPAAVGVDAAALRAKSLADQAVEALEPFGEPAWGMRAIARFIVERRS